MQSQTLPLGLLASLLFILIGPIALLPTFAALTGSIDRAMQVRIALVAAATALITFALAVFIGAGAMAQAGTTPAALISGGRANPVADGAPQHFRSGTGSDGKAAGPIRRGSRLRTSRSAGHRYARRCRHHHHFRELLPQPVRSARDPRCHRAHRDSEPRGNASFSRLHAAHRTSTPPGGGGGVRCLAGCHGHRDALVRSGTLTAVGRLRSEARAQTRRQ